MNYVEGRLTAIQTVVGNLTINMLQGSWRPNVYIFSASDAWCAISQSVSAVFQATEI